MAGMNRLLIKKTTALIILAVVFLFVFTVYVPNSYGFDLGSFWQRPVNGGIGGNDSIENSLNPKDCAMCHEAQFKDWSKSRHAASFSPGLTGQYDDNDPSFTYSCNYCHGPLKSQQKYLFDYESSEFVKNDNFNPALEASGVSCAVCHVRNLKRYGPKARAQTTGGDLPHDGFIVKDFFSDSKYCASCHQFDPGDYKLNGKFMEDTYGEWSLSKYPEAGITCQSCHMPNRAHEFKGIHDKDFVLSGLTIKSGKDFLRRSYYMEIKSTAVGHKFPTYSTPLVELRSFIKRADGTVIEDSLKEEYIGWVIGLDVQTEYMDTRLNPGESYVTMRRIGKFKAGGLANEFQGGEKLVFEIIVYPDMFYKRFYENMLSTESYSDKALIEEALKRASSSSYLLYMTSHNL